MGMEACGSSQYWARELQKLGHTVNLMAPSAVKPYVSGFKSYRKDAIGIFNAMLAGVRKVAVKTEAVTDLATLLGIRARGGDSQDSQNKYGSRLFNGIRHHHSQRVTPV